MTNNQSNYCELPDISGDRGLVAGVDEVGRGALFGPVVAAAVILPPSTLPQLALAGVRDSKQLSSNRRLKLAKQIQELALEWKIGYATREEIDKINILQASLLAMKRAVLKLKIKPDICLVDGKQSIIDLPIPQKLMVKGDARSLEIAAASIVAKVWRDDLIDRWAIKYPNYDLAANKGYGTEKHRLALQKYGPSAMHRLSFRLTEKK
ncbi:MAG TPA: ribonuclease HII [Cyanobacteria bacterium UBA11149]|nr:ribonuclease HII [Cyanobacteria bacterium UBA11367]HBE58422.1 ribonuclease HII [Cyanobacteria bacterium UBA11366]HBK65515.1 ribonuclease HII [Cyanobacteria bacterium UBA11166]HBR77180.1 ribonuclease HII [Cyanobacteria bacterium UBA11159]HBS71328.1 ribonuclease HII [Cyanobacteria bacterium UBA11153]HBW88347.1 ribonuclease HII [Cyanobacteria bacterium UBA11149]